MIRISAGAENHFGIRYGTYEIQVCPGVLIPETNNQCSEANKALYKYRPFTIISCLLLDTLFSLTAYQTNMS